ncbi:hypothetical protein [Aquabacterium sp.]|uniref:hypothetical protein n=1 Tax=Aquabacterium sp. TaxID=1872578 RepID=UPI004037C5AE
MPYPLEETVFKRTHKGQVVATSRKAFVDERRFSMLRMVTGFTSARVLSELSGTTLFEVLEMLHALEAQGLIERFDAP